MLFDAQAGQAAEIVMPPRSVLRIVLPRPPAQRPAHIGDLRRFVLADLIARTAEHRHNLAVVTTLAGPAREAGGPGAGDGLRDACDSLNIRPAEQAPGGPAAEPGPAGPGTIWVGARQVPSGQVLFDGYELAGPQEGLPAADAPGPDLSALAARGLDPLTLRLAYLSARYRDPVQLSWEILGQADAQLRRWREQVARWAELPSKPMWAAVSAQVTAAFDNDVNSPAALAALSSLEQDPQIPAGSKLESFLHADQLLGLDLPRAIGTVS